MENDYFGPGYKKYDFTIDEGKGRVNPSRDQKLRRAPPEERWRKKQNKAPVVWPSSCVAPAEVCPHINRKMKSDVQKNKDDKKKKKKRKKSSYFRVSKKTSTFR